MIQYNMLNGSGHVFNFVKHNNKFYTIDYTHYKNDMLESTALETGKLEDYYRSDIIAGNIHEMDTMKPYVYYIRAKFKDVPEFFAIYRTDNPSLVGTAENYNNRKLYFPKALNFNVLYDNPNDNLIINFIEGL